MSCNLNRSDKLSIRLGLLSTNVVNDGSQLVDLDVFIFSIEIDGSCSESVELSLELIGTSLAFRPRMERSTEFERDVGDAESEE
uniref:Uncharacterized protein n=1 Tax=Angiostrongylus cantonensis TaxID=6313 RepID=A0A0K0D016_ANGCA